MPEDGLTYEYTLELKFPTLDRLLEKREPQYKDISESIDAVDSLAFAEDTALIASVPDTISIDTADTTELQVNRKWVNVDSMRSAEKYLQPIEFKGGDASVLYRFFEALEKAQYKKGKTHVFHYGDSQLEGDRMTSYIRDRLQKKFGGYGLGMVPASHNNQVKLLRHETSDNWWWYPSFFKSGADGATDGYGALTSYATYTPYPTDSSLNGKEINKAWVSYDVSRCIFNNAKKFKQVKLFYGPVYDAVRFTFPIKDTTFTDYMKGRKAMNVVKLDFNDLLSTIELKFESKISPQIFGVSLESPTGVQVNNIAMRGSSGTVFRKTDKELFGMMHVELNTSLIILQFGGNVMPYLRDEQHAKDYGYGFRKEIEWIKEAVPGVAVLVIGPSDMSRKVEDYYETYPLLESVRDELKHAAFSAGAGYWDMYEAMGGKNSMPSWVGADPALAVSDYTHFSPRGARVISEFFFKALMIEYDAYNNQKIKDELSQTP
ncbi:MAG: hypothetical protein Salg2KO_03840 [Salibacteraceae bacterium]